MDIGLLLLRLLLGCLLFGHGAQKMFGWFGGSGPSGTGTVFETWGLRPGAPLVVLAAACELLSAALLALGLLSPLAAAIAFGTMVVAVSVNVGKGLWAQSGGYEVPLVYGGIAVSLGFAGPGDWSLDHLTGIDAMRGAQWGIAAVVAGLLTAGAFIAYAAYHRNPQPA
jgi:putative oxidoreductase